MMPQRRPKPDALQDRKGVDLTEADSDASPATLFEFCKREVSFYRLSGTDGEEIVQDALLDLLLRQSSVRNPRAYLKVIIRRRCAIARRQRWLETRSLLGTGSPPEGANDPWAVTNLRIDLTRAIRSLGKAEQRLAGLVRRGLSFAEIADALLCSIGAARVRVFRLRRKFSRRT
jgi:DNA-directed RNA polymerase specialized sigma24 family protein